MAARCFLLAAARSPTRNKRAHSVSGCVYFLVLLQRNQVMLDFSPGYRQASSLPKQGCICRQTATTDSRALIHNARSQTITSREMRPRQKASPTERYQKYRHEHPYPGFQIIYRINLVAKDNLRHRSQVLFL